MRHRSHELIDRTAARIAKVGRAVSKLELQRQSIQARLHDIRRIYDELLAVADELNRRRLQLSIQR